MGTTIDVLENIFQGSGQRAGRVVLGVLPTGRTDRLTSRDVNTPPTTAVENKYTNRFDDPTYYTA